MRGLILLVHGIGEHSNRYDEIANYLTQWGYDVLSLDLPGHGLTTRKGGFERFADLDEMVREIKDTLRYWMVDGPDASQDLRNKPVYLLGHSMGALTSLYWLCSQDPSEEFPFMPQKVLVSAPPVDLALKVPL